MIYNDLNSRKDGKIVGNMNEKGRKRERERYATDKASHDLIILAASQHSPWSFLFVLRRLGATVELADVGTQKLPDGSEVK